MSIRRLAVMSAREMRVNRHGQAAGFRWRRWHPVACIEKTWTLPTEWWRGDDERTDRQYLEAVRGDGLHCVIFHDRVAAV